MTNILLWFGVMVFNATFKTISVISWRSVLLVEKTEYSEKSTDLPQMTDKLDHMMLYRVQFAWAEFELTTLVVMDTDYTGSCKSNYDHGHGYDGPLMAKIKRTKKQTNIYKTLHRKQKIESNEPYYKLLLITLAMFIQQIKSSLK